MMLKLLLVVAVLFFPVLGNFDKFPPYMSSGTSAYQNQDDCSFVNKLKTAFKEKNPKIETIHIIDVRPSVSGDPKYFVLARGIRSDMDFKGDFSDEMFGLFVVDSSLRNIEKVVEFIPTPRWNDTDVRIKNVETDSITVEGKGQTYGGVLLTRKYKLGVTK